MDDPAHVRSGTAASGDEVRAVASEIAGAAAIHVGADNRKAFLYDPEPVPPLLHIATHAVADANAMEQSRILFSPPREGASGADYLFLREAYELKLGGVELAVLSACETERGRQLRGEGVQSFSRAFLAAGARTTVTTLWRVPDGPTATFMTVFYHHLQRGEPRAEALRLAKVRFLESGAPLSDPHFWAAFVLTGEGLQPIPRAVRWTTVGVAIAGLMVAMLAAAVAVRRRYSHR
jgi:CHAT domain-containing protein